MPNHCIRCHRKLKDPESIRLGFGPVCWLKTKAGSTFQMSMFDGLAERSDFAYRFDAGEPEENAVLVIIDLDRGGMSATNNMEAILQRISDLEGFDISTSHNKLPIVYMDSEGAFDGVSIKDTGVVEFYPLSEEPVTEETEAVELARKGER